MENPKNKVRVSYFPRYETVRLLLPIWNGENVSRVKSLRNAIYNLRGTPQSPLNWLDPPTWIRERLNGSDRELANEIWHASEGRVNPRHTDGSWIVCTRFQLLHQESGWYSQLVRRWKRIYREPTWRDRVQNRFA